MKILLKEDVDNLGLAGEVHQVAPGYGRNYLLPRGLAVLATPNAMKEASSWRSRAEMRRAQIKSENQSIATRIHETRLIFTAKAGESGKLYGSITMANVADKLKSEIGIDIDRHKLESEPLRQLGEHKVVVNLGHSFRPEVTVMVQQES